MKTPDQFRSLLQQGAPLVADGATGTNLQKRGLPVGTPSDFWVLENPDAVLALHRDFVAAGSDIILTDTFGARELQLRKVNLGDKAAEINHRAVELAQKAVGDAPVWVAGSMGPLGELLAPYGSLTLAEAEAQFSAQAAAMLSAGVDLIVVETQYDLVEAQAAVRAVRALSAEIPLVCSFSYDRGVRTMMGVRPSQMAKTFADLNVDALGINCGHSLEDNLKCLQELRQSTALPIWFKPNAGLPHADENGETTYDAAPADMGGLVPGWLEAGAAVVGGCCGTSPEHLAAIAGAVKARQS